MTTLLERTFSRTLDRLVENTYPTGYLEAWTFDTASDRRIAEAKLAKRGVRARIRSAYKPLLHYFLEELNLPAVHQIEIICPAPANAAPNRFRLEAYPLAGLVGTSKLTFRDREDDALAYEVALETVSGLRVVHHVLAPNHLVTDALGETCLVPTGWIRTDPQTPGQRLSTDYEKLYNAAIHAVAKHDWNTRQPFFERLDLAITYPADDERLPYGDEVMSLREALAEDLYFSLLELFQKKAGRPLGDREFCPGQIVPDVRLDKGPITLKIATRPLDPSLQAERTMRLDEATRPLGLPQIAEELEKVGGAPFHASARSGREVLGCHLQGTDVPVMLSSGQHANETSGPVGALRAAQKLAKREGANFTVSPLDNPDGYALHQQLRVNNPRHMHHAARYTALGDDLECRTSETFGPELLEKDIRVQASALSKAKLHVSLHGYPSHEWTRPFTGYVPRGFSKWTLPKGFFLIVRYKAGWKTEAESLLDIVTTKLARIPGLAAMNQRQIDLYKQHAGALECSIQNGFVCECEEDERYTAPVTLITEYPDETIYGEAFILAHTAQMEAALAAYGAWQGILAARLAEHNAAA